ncbi:NUDIX hydrolase domain-like protein [Umbelopsis sp. PMI_123]|nr:NUDIX hydrolase domain-like protein [Umbelopsis sp. PMI_123]
MTPIPFAQDSLYALCSNLTSRRNTLKIDGDTRRACVAVIIRWRRGQYDRTPIDTSYKARNWMEFVQDKMVQRDGGYPEILYIRRAKRSGDPWSGDMAFPGGRNEAGETDQDTVVREVREEVGLNLDSDDYVKLGCLDDRELTSLLGGKPIMILSTFVYLQVSSESPQITRQNSEVAATYWIPLHHFLNAKIHISNPIKLPVLPLSSKLPSMFGTVAMPSMIVPVKEENIVLWGLALTMTSELVSYTQSRKEIARHGHVVPLVRMTKAFPKLSQWDLDGFVRLFCFASSSWRVLNGGYHSKISTSWAGGPPIPDYYGSLRRAVYVVTALRATAGLTAGGFLAHRIIKAAYGSR